MHSKNIYNIKLKFKVKIRHLFLESEALKITYIKLLHLVKLWQVKFSNISIFLKIHSIDDPIYCFHLF